MPGKRTEWPSRTTRHYSSPSRPSLASTAPSQTAPRSATPDPSNNTTSDSLGAGALAARDGDELDAIRSAGALERAAVMSAVESAPQRTVTTAPS